MARLLSEYFTFAYVIVGLVFIGWITREMGKVVIARQKAIVKLQPKPEKESIAKKLPDSAYELLQQAELGLDKFGQDMAESLRKKGVADPMTDAGYSHLVSRLNQVRQWRVSYESNPLFQMADSIGWPIVKRLPDRAIEMLEGIVS